MQIETTKRYHFAPISMVIMKTKKIKTKTENNNCWWRGGETGTLVLCWECKMAQPLWKTDGSYSKD